MYFELSLYDTIRKVSLVVSLPPVQGGDFLRFYYWRIFAKGCTLTYGRFRAFSWFADLDASLFDDSHRYVANTSILEKKTKENADFLTRRQQTKTDFTTAAFF